MKNKEFSGILLVVLLLIIGFLIYTLNKNDLSEDYQNVLSQIEEANTDLIRLDQSDQCFGYRIFNRGCSYTDTSLTQSTLKSYTLTHEEVINLCYEFAHKGATAYCLSMNNEREKCYAFAETNTYLQRVCNLEEGEIIPSQRFGPYEGDTPQKVDSWETIEPVKYSELI